MQLIARLFQKDDPLIIIAYCLVEEKDAPDAKPIIVLVDDDNRIKEIR